MSPNITEQQKQDLFDAIWAHPNTPQIEEGCTKARQEDGPGGVQVYLDAVRDGIEFAVEAFVKQGQVTPEVIHNMNIYQEIHDTFTQALKNDPSPKIRAKAAETLGRLRIDLAFTDLLDALNDEDATVRASAARAMADLGEYTAIQALLKRLEDPDEDVRHQAIEAIGAIAES